MSKTTELYYESAYITEFDAEVIACKGDENGKFEIILDKTAFFPEQGGQSSDIGLFTDESGATCDMLHASISEENGETIVRHTTDGALAVGSRVHGSVDWEHRFSNMQQHTGEHIFSGIVSEKFGYDNVGFHLSDSEVTMDYNGVLTVDDIREIELLVNRAIWENVRVTAQFPSKEELDKIDYRSKKELTGDVRIVTVEGYDVCACCAPHVDRTGEIGLLKVVSLQNYKKGVRVSILCGKRALLFLQKEHDMLSELSGRFTTSTDKVMASVNKLFEDNDELKGKLNAANDKLMDHELENIDKTLSDVFLVKEKEFDQNLMRNTVNKLAADRTGYCGVFAGDETGYRFIIASGTDKKDCKTLMDILKSEFGAKGGGSNAMIQGSITGADISEVLGKCR
ncbi:MAG: hypothetical protein IKO84_07850 [Butyrivibrio sp.]|nr:hypothetical protein [Butyrivibrio sp.]